MALLTDRVLATGVTLSDYIHVVIPSDISQNPAGSSYKATVSQVADVFSNLFVNQSGDTMTGPLIVPTISATTYQNLPIGPDTYVTGYTYSSNTFTIKQNNGQPNLTTTINIVTGWTVNGNLTVTGNTSLQSTTASTLNLSSVPTTDVQLVAQYLTRDSATGEVKTKIISGPAAYGLFAQTGDSAVVSATTTPTTIIDGGVGTLTVPANGFTAGDSFLAKLGGVLSSKANDDLTIIVSSNGVTLVSSGPINMPNITVLNPSVWLMEVTFTIRKIGGTGIGSIVSLGNFTWGNTTSGAQEGFGFNDVNSTTFNTTISNVLDIKVQWNTTDPQNRIYSDVFVLTKTF
jgi:hypothetical protein